jgi:hypothetical protein
MKSIKKLIELVAYKKQLDQTRAELKFTDNEWLLDAIISEVEEVKEEIKPNNRAYLEDELSDILWGWLSLVENLKSEGLVGSHEAIFKRALKKYEERILPLKGTSEDHAIWREVKKKQKEGLQREKLMEESEQCN